IARAGGHAAKFQTYKADKIATKDHSPSYWDLKSEPTTNQHALFLKYDSFGPEEYRALAKTCAEAGIDFVSTPFDLEAVDWLDPLMPFFKVASADITNIPLLRKVASKGKPVLLSTGAATPEEVRHATETLRRAGAPRLTLLHCVLNYPTPKDHAQMAQLDALMAAYGSEHTIGYSDHVRPDENGAMPVLELAALRGAVVLEKHFTDDNLAPGNDHYHAMDESDLRAFLEKMAIYRTLHGGTGPRRLEWEERARTNARRRIVASRTLKAGEKIDEAALVALRANQGIEVSHWDEVLGRTTARPVQEGSPLAWEDLNG
ncbi:MAG: N-acetylneuraminate synthase family protein, partial [Bdellovibrionales bacterium]|nr:N-acetylneuraminate synthase family protein [Bdellovibrionales bacterium]